MYRNIKKIKEFPVLSGVIIIILCLTILYIYTSNRNYKPLIQNFDNINYNKDLTMDRPFLHIYDSNGKKVAEGVINTKPELEEEPVNNVSSGNIAGMDAGHMNKSGQKKWASTNRSSKKKRLRDIMGEKV